MVVSFSVKGSWLRRKAVGRGTYSSSLANVGGLEKSTSCSGWEVGGMTACPSFAVGRAVTAPRRAMSG